MKIEKDKKEDLIFEEPSEEQLQAELAEIQRKRLIYQKEQAEAVLAGYKEEYYRKKKRFRAVVKAALVVLVSGTCLFAFSMRSEATRMWWLETVERIIGVERGRVVNNDNQRVISDISEEAAIAEIKEKTGIPMPKVYYKPVEMIFDGYDYDEINCRGSLYYLCEEQVVKINAYDADNNATYSWKYDGVILSEESIETPYGEVMIHEIKAETDEEASLVAEWTYQNHQYQIEGKLSFEEMKKIIENFLF